MAAVQRPATQACPVMHAVPQAPQWAGSVWVLTQRGHSIPGLVGMAQGPMQVCRGAAHAGSSVCTTVPPLKCDTRA
jgi:hypothetical protein